MRQIFWVALGGIAVLLGVVGIFLPLLPTTPFLLVAAFAFARGSDRLHNWLIDHAHLGPPIHAWREHGAISKSAKIAATIALLAMVAISVVMGIPPWIIGVQCAVAACVGTFLWTRPLPP